MLFAEDVDNLYCAYSSDFIYISKTYLPSIYFLQNMTVMDLLYNKCKNTHC